METRKDYGNPMGRDTDRELLQQALEQLEHAMRYWDYRHIVDALRDRLARQEQEQEPVAWMEDCIELYVSEKPSATYTIPLYTAPPPAREWVCKHCGVKNDD